MAATGLLFVGAVLFINGLSLIGWVKGKSLVPMDLFVGLLQVITPLYLIFTSNGDPAVILGASGLFLFGFTYLYVAINNTFDLDGSGLGWFCLYVVFAAIVYAFFNFRTNTPGGNVLGVLWVSWAFLWGLFWLVLSLGKTSLTRYTGAVCATQGIITGFIPALILIGQPDWFTTQLAIAIAVVGIVLDVIYYFTVKTPAPSAAATSTAAASPAY
jgi:AmiS/UreI family transporter.